jgi:hypothetical protein
LGSGTADDARWSGLVFAVGDPDSVEAARRVSPCLSEAEGLIGSIISLLGLTLRVPDHTTLGRRSAALAVPRPNPAAADGDAQPVHLLYQTAVTPTGMRAGLVSRLRAKSMRYQPADYRQKSQSFGRLVLVDSTGC